MAKAVLTYVAGKHVVSDLLDHNILHKNNGRLLTDWAGDDPEPEIFRQLTAKTVSGRKVRDQGDALIRWRVERPGDVLTGTWEDPSLAESWQRFYASEQKAKGLCMVTGNIDGALAKKHPAKIRNSADKAKLISSNDKDGYTYRGRFLEADEACGISFEASQKAHNALQWLISRQAYKASGQVFVAWSVSGVSVPDPFKDSKGLFLDAEEIDAIPPDTIDDAGDVGQTFSLRLNKAIRGYGARLAPSEDIVVMGLDSATPGRMAITFYREIKASEFLRRIEAWHAKCAWPQNFGNDKHFVGAPAPRDIAEAAFGRRLDDKLRKATVERLLPCIVDGQPIPRDLVVSTVGQASNRAGLENWEWKKCLGIACALFKGYHTEREYKMGLEHGRDSRDYLYGRLLAVADHIEGRALFVADEKRDTTAARLMQRFADHPLSTWRTIELAMAPYKSRLRASRGAFLWEMEKLLDEIIAGFRQNDFVTDSALTGEFLLGYHCQRQALRATTTTVDSDPIVDEKKG
jgi:CRISPR-associated protein Csd1